MNMSLPMLTAFACAIVGCSTPETSATDTTQVPPADTAKRVAALGGKLTVPAGFKVSYFAQNLPGVRMMILGPGGIVYASQPGANRVVRLPDGNHDGAADSIQVVQTGLNEPTGMAFHGSWLYIANTDGVVRVPINSVGMPTGPIEPLNTFSGTNGHSTRTIVFGADDAMYVSIGSSCNLCIERYPDRATVMRYDADGKNGRVFAKGLRNAVGLALHPVTKEIWVSQHERDNIQPDHENLPPEEVNILKDGGDYGWPYCYTDPSSKRAVPNPEYPDPARCATTIPAALPMQAHSAPLGVTFLNNATNFPADYHDDMLIAFHGSWNRSVPTGAKVVRVHITANKPVSYEDFVTGWQTSDGSRWGRPVDVLVIPDGSVLISDDNGGAIFRVYR